MSARMIKLLTALAALTLAVLACDFLPNGLPFITPPPIITPFVMPTVVGIPSNPTPTQLPAATEIPAQPTVMPTPVFTATAVPPTFTPKPSPTPLIMPFQVQAGGPAVLANFAHPEKACAWLGVAGQAFGLDGKPLEKLVVVITGTLNGAAKDLISTTGSARAYGPQGYEIVLAATPVDSKGMLFIQLFGLDGKPLSANTPLTTSAQCGQNLMIVNFQQVK